MTNVVLVSVRLVPHTLIKKGFNVQPVEDGFIVFLLKD